MKFLWRHKAYWNIVLKQRVTMVTLWIHTHRRTDNHRQVLLYVCIFLMQEYLKKPNVYYQSKKRSNSIQK